MIIGEILLSEGVNPLGGRTYNIPINIAQGCNGAQLNINMVYNTMAKTEALDTMPLSSLATNDVMM